MGTADSGINAVLAPLAQPGYSVSQQLQQPQGSFVAPSFIAPSSVAPIYVAPYENPERKRMREVTDDYLSRDDGYNKRPNTNSYQNDHEGYNGRSTANDYVGYNGRSNVDSFKGRNEGYTGRNNTERSTPTAAKNWDRKPKYTDDNNPKKFLLPCAFWERGECRKGAKCTYRHDS